MSASAVCSCRWRRLAWLLAGCVVACAATAQEQRPPPSQELLKARQYQQAGQTLRAAEAFEAAATEAELPEQRAQALVELGVLYSKDSRLERDHRTKDRQAADAFLSAYRESSGALRVQAANNYAVQMLELGEPQAAARILLEVAEEKQRAELDPVAVSRTSFNLARALEETGDIAAAGDQYSLALASDPLFQPAEEALLRVALAAPSGTTGIAQLSALVRTLLEQGSYEAAAQRLKSGLWHAPWWTEARYGGLVDLLAETLAAFGPLPAEFARSWSPELARLEFALAEIAPPLARQLHDIRDAGSGEVPLILDAWDAKARYSAWEGHGGYLRLSALLKATGDRYARSGEPEQALPRYATAWALDSTNMDAAVYLATLIAHKSDPELLNQFMFVAFGEKQQAYLGGDWENILRCHSVLGSLFEDLEAWGPESNARSAIFQWTHAIRAHGNLPDRGPAPALHERLARALAADGQPGRAWRHYAEATNSYLRLGQYTAAERAARAALALNYQAEPAERERMQRQLELAGERGAREGARW